ncbi:hypothetical protein [Rhodoferax sp.]|uniref:hypothetical protein n=1 Tax=Rhodoferax sp. TaxID=50421 RepID=UPI00260F86C7|nr:hypothetical protein [Rhodoferax sp.]MDD3937676.1 hypothetical protein [Rhodoferax sp.]
MSGAKMATTGRGVRIGSNTTRPSGASAWAASRDPDALNLAINSGNRQTRRLASKNLKKMQRKAAASLKGVQ